MTQRPRDSAQQLRTLAEQNVREDAEDVTQETMSPEAVKQLLHELRVHQVELEMQNEELRRSQHDIDVLRARYFDLYNLAPVGYLTLSEQGTIVEANLTSANLLGVARGSLVKRLFSSFIFLEDQDRYYLYRKQLAETGGSPRECELRMVRTDGSLFWAHLQAISAREAETTTECRMVVRDCTRQKVAEIEVRASKEQWEKTFDAIDDVVTVHDLDMQIIRANKAAGDLFQVAPAELIGKQCYELFRGTSEACQGCPEISARKDQANQQANIYHENLGKTFSVSSYPLVEQGGIIGFVSIAKDITEQLQLEERLRQAKKVEAIGTLAGGIAHNFNNILVPILGYAELAESRIAPDDPLNSDLQHIIKGALRAKDMIAQILAFSRKSPEKRQSFQPQLVVVEALKLLQASLPATIKVKTEIASDCGTILADPTQLHQIVMNLCVNAHHAMVESGGVLKVGLEKVIIGKEESKALGSGLFPGEYVVLEVSDTGCGMDRETQERIFEPYFTTKCQGEGSGMGLSVVHGMVTNYQGHISVQSEPGKGTSFLVYLPCSVEGLPLRLSKSSVPEAGGTERIVVVDDEVVITTMFQTILTRMGYQVIVFNNSLEALAFISQDPDSFDLLFTDMRMPNLTGLELIQKALAVRPELPVILCTGFNKLVNKQKAKALGIDVCLEKPVSVPELILAIHKALAEKGKVSG